MSGNVIPFPDRRKPDDYVDEILFDKPPVITDHVDHFTIEVLMTSTGKYVGMLSVVAPDHSVDWELELDDTFSTPQDAHSAALVEAHKRARP